MSDHNSLTQEVYGIFKQYLKNQGFKDVKGAVILQIKQKFMNFFGNTCSSRRLMLKRFKDFCESHPSTMTSEIQSDIRAIIKGNFWTGSPRNSLAAIIHYFLVEYKAIIPRECWISQGQICAEFQTAPSTISTRKYLMLDTIKSLKGETYFMKLLISFITWLI